MPRPPRSFARRTIRPGIFFALALLGCAVAATEVYRWTDADGTVHFGSRPPASQDAKLLFTSKTPPRSRAETKRKRARVKKVVDGDTLEFTNGMRVRLAGINAPEVAHRGKPGAPGGEAAKRYLESLVDKQRISWEMAEEPRDRYGRHLAHVYTDDGTNVNQRLLQEGLVHATIYPPNLNHIPEYLAMEKRARDMRLGIWSSHEYREFRSMEMSDARNRFRRVRVLIKEIGQNGNNNILRTEDDFALMINRANETAFAPLTQFLGNELLVRGWVKMRRKQLYIELRHPLQIEERIAPENGPQDNKASKTP